jgi:outer membrane protein OmpA-like peptidoglycan-associated protein
MKKVGLLLFLGLATLSISAQEEVSTKSGGKTTFVKNGFWDNWFLGAGANGTVYVAGDDQHADFLDRPTLGGKIFVGKWFSPVLGARLAVDGGGLHTFDAHRMPPSGDYKVTMNSQEYLNPHVDLMVNLTNFFMTYKENRFYNFIPYVGVGYAHGFKNEWKAWENNTISFNGGLLNTFRLSNRLSAFLDVSGTIVDDGFDGDVGGDWSWDGMATASVGLSLKLGSKGFAPATLWDQGLIDDLNSTINQQRARISELEKRPISCPEVKPCPPCPDGPKVSNEVFVPNVVFFKIGSAAIQSNQEINIFNTAEYMKANSDAKVKVVGYADKKTGSASRNMIISEKRAKAVANALINKYGISSDRVTVEWKGASEQPYEVNEWNRVAIFFAD